MKMKKALSPLLVVFGAFAVVIALSCFNQQQTGNDKIPWRKDLGDAQKEAAAAHKPVLAYFTATWCGPCQQMHRTTWSNDKVGSALSSYVPVKLDVDEQSKIAAKYGIQSIPTYMILDDQGKPIRSESGYRDADDFLQWLNGK
jgi:thiol:disulfide interchange protein